MKYLLLSLTVLLTTSAQAYFGDDLFSDVQCVQSIGKMSCESGGFWEGNNYTTCTLPYRVFTTGQRYEIRTLETSGAAENNRFLTDATLGISNIISNPISAASAKVAARKEMTTKMNALKLVPRCR